MRTTWSKRGGRSHGARRVLAGLAVGVAAAVFSVPAPARADGPHAVWVKWDELPRRVQETVDRERGRNDLKQILRLRDTARTYYRIVVDTRGDDRVLFVAEGGTLFRAGEVPDVQVGAGSFEKWVYYRDLPRDVRDTLDRERGRLEVKQVWFVRRNNREFYRCIVDTRGDDLAYRIGPNGKLLSIDEVDDVAVGTGEARRYETERERWVRIDDVPRAARRVIDDEFRGREVRRVILVERGGRSFYRVVTEDRVIRVSEDGYLYRDREIADVAYGPETWDSPYGKELWIKYRDLPPTVADTLDRERRGREVKQVFYVKRGRWTYYRAIIDTRGDDLAVRIGESGKLLGREEVEDTAIGGAEVEAFTARETWVKYGSLPRGARDTLDRERGRNEVLKIVRVDLGPRSYYRCTLESRPYPTIVKIDESGRVVR